MFCIYSSVWFFQIFDFHCVDPLQWAINGLTGNFVWDSYEYESHINLKRTGIFFFCLGFLSRTFTILDHKSLIVNCFSRPHPFKSFKGYLPQILLGPLLNISSHIIVAVQGQTGTGQKYSNIFENNQIACGI